MLRPTWTAVAEQRKLKSCSVAKVQVGLMVDRKSRWDWIGLDWIGLIDRYDRHTYGIYGIYVGYTMIFIWNLWGL